MNKPVIFYFVHAHGAGHRATFRMLYPQLQLYFNVIPVTTNKEITKYLEDTYNIKVIELPPKYPAHFTAPEHTFSKAFEVTPYVKEAANRAEFLARCIKQHNPVALYCDGVPEIAIMTRGMGVPVVLVHLPGDIRSDPTQVFAHELADHIVAHFPQKLEQSNYRYTRKTIYSGYLSQFGPQYYNERSANKNDIAIVLGSDAYDQDIMDAITNNDQYNYTIIGNRTSYRLGDHCRQIGRVSNIMKELKGDIVITAAGQNTIAEMISLKKKLIVLPEPRPYNEQIIHAEQLRINNIAFVANENFTPYQWARAIEKSAISQPRYEGLVNYRGAELITSKLEEWYGSI
jgi:UDP-N-acetylglucosamine:LPS N-acetylglucosamine transferase